jgi:hypothetical protein
LCKAFWRPSMFSLASEGKSSMLFKLIMKGRASRKH